MGRLNFWIANVVVLVLIALWVWGYLLDGFFSLMAVIKKEDA